MVAGGVTSRASGIRSSSRARVWATSHSGSWTATTPRSLQAIPQQLNQLQQLAYIQQQQLQQLQQVIQIVPQQLEQLLQLLAQQQFGSSLHQGIGPLTQQPQGFASPFQAFSPYTAPLAGSGQVM